MFVAVTSEFVSLVFNRFSVFWEGIMLFKMK